VPQAKLLAVSLCKNKKKLHDSKIQWHTINIPIPKWRNKWYRKEGSDKARLKKLNPAVHVQYLKAHGSMV
jgi:hypothetical protein